ncbi:monovalent cation/H+ antiporter subunit D [Pseudoalteromonas tunicata]|jgi:multicomponent K+:H+ antiporter subunit D|uniref:NADH dehydrogenase subunit N n=1 Tax=Pseudoalteromonas tunicata D2 TaxID=87626 RepID=A4CDC9_9GAMM|nr:monovalent cation/H+ antiporter subunit D [Pseudoalteromonas tunicata]ATC94077.1 multicomponent K+:H+ antiporter subunit D [Pseudoalteromonas tunicata]AXT29858.1 monovalent cation/H+ antiporter subunit D [Pseudoalteromonas tunicata]EAR27572.1 NADH dehydrogenase subunit N [Pseudoalteromonas tunicata D2]
MHLVTLTVLIPMLAAVVLLLPPSGKSVQARRITSVIFACVTLIVSIALLVKTLDGQTIVYAIGDWKAPFGIVLIGDRLSALLVTLTSFLALCCVTYSLTGDDEKGSFFHPLMHFLTLGVNGAFLTGDLFNLFVFFEVLLIASYSLLMHGVDKQKTRAALHYVILNLVGSSVFLIALGILYGVLGTLNIADMALKVSQLSGDDVALAKIGGLLLLIVFALKAAILPLHMWLPSTYSTAMPVVGAMFAIMTKVGVYAMFRVYTVIFGAYAGSLDNMAAQWLWPLAIITIFVGALGVLASQDFRRLVANLVVVSVGTLVAAVAMHSVMATAAALYYIIHSTVLVAALFLLAELIGLQRGKTADRLVPARAVTQPLLLGSCFIIASLGVIGMPPLSGFIGKIWFLEAALEVNLHLSFWPVYLLASLMIMIALSRAGSQLFWKQSNSEPSGERAKPVQIAMVIVLLSCTPLMVVFAGPISEFTLATATQLHDVQGHVNAVIGVSLEGQQ